MIYDWTLNVTYNVNSNCTVNPDTTPFEGQNSAVGTNNYQNIQTYTWTADDVNPNTNYCSISSGASDTIAAYGECATNDILTNPNFPYCEQSHSHTVVVSYNPPDCDCIEGEVDYTPWAQFGECGSGNCGCQPDQYCERRIKTIPYTSAGTPEDCVDNCQDEFEYEYQCISDCVVEGCTDETACNYYEFANSDDGTYCTYPNQDMAGNQCGDISPPDVCPECNVDDLGGTCAEQPFLCCLDDTGNGGCDVDVNMEIISSITVCPTWAELGTFTGPNGCPIDNQAAEYGFSGNYVPYDNNPDDCFQDSDCAYEYSICDDGTCSCIDSDYAIIEYLETNATNENTSQIITQNTQGTQAEYALFNYNGDKSYVDLDAENLQYFETELGELVGQTYSITLPNNDGTPDYHIMPYDSRYQSYINLHSIYTDGYNAGDASTGTLNDRTFLETELAKIVSGGEITGISQDESIEYYTANQYENRVVTPGPNQSGADYAIYSYDVLKEYVDVSVELSNFLTNQQTTDLSGSPAQIDNVDTNFIIFDHNGDKDYVDVSVELSNFLTDQQTTNSTLSPAQIDNVSTDFIIFPYIDNTYTYNNADTEANYTDETTAYQAGVADTYIDLFVTNLSQPNTSTVANDGLKLIDYDPDGVGGEQYVTFRYTEDYQYRLPADTDEFQQADNVEYLETQLYDITTQFTKLGPYSSSQSIDVDNDGQNDTFQYAIFPLDDNLPDSVYAQFNQDGGINTLNDLYEAGITAGQTDTFQDEDNNQAIEDFIKEAIDSQEGNTMTTTPGLDEINVAIFEHNPNANVSYNASDTEPYADETAAYNQGYDDGVDSVDEQIQYPAYVPVTNYSYPSGQSQVGNIYITNLSPNTLTILGENPLQDYYSVDFVSGDNFIFKNENGYNLGLSLVVIPGIATIWSLLNSETGELTQLGDDFDYEIPSGTAFEFRPGFRVTGNYGEFNFIQS